MKESVGFLQRMYVFDHQKKDVMSAIGITASEQQDKLMSTLLTTLSLHACVSRRLQSVVNDKDLTDCEKIFLLFALGKAEGQVDSSSAKELQAILGKVKKHYFGK